MLLELRQPLLNREASPSARKVWMLIAPAPVPMGSAPVAFRKEGVDADTDDCTCIRSPPVAFRKEGVDADQGHQCVGKDSRVSPSARKVWMLITMPCSMAGSHWSPSARKVWMLILLQMRTLA